MNWYQLSSIGICILLGVGIALHRRPSLHAKIMLIAFVADGVLGGALEFSRHVFDKALGTGGEAAPSPMLIFHITVATIGFLLYLPQIYWGRKLLRGERHVLSAHRKGAIAFVIFRLANLITSFMI